MNNDELKKILRITHPKYTFEPSRIRKTYEKMKRPSSFERPSIFSIKCDEGEEEKYLLEINDLALKRNGDACAFMARILKSKNITEQFSLEYLLIGSQENNPECKYFLAEYCADHGQEEEEIFFRKDLLYQNVMIGARKLIEKLWELGRKEEAFVCLKKWETFAPSYRGLINLLGCHYMCIGDYENAFEVYKRNEKEFSYELGYLYFHGLGVDADLNKALLYFRKDVGQGHPYSNHFNDDESEFKLAMCYYYGYGVEKNIEKVDFFVGRFLFFRQKEYFDSSEQGIFLSTCGFYERVKKRASTLCEEGKNDPYKYLEAFWLYYLYRRKFKEEEAITYLKKAADNGVKEAICLLAYWEKSPLNDLKKPYLKKAEKEGLKDVSQALYELSESKDREKFLSSLCEENWNAYLEEILYWTAKDKNVSLFAKAVHMANRIPLERFLFFKFLGMVFFPLYEDCDQEEARKFYQRLLLNDYCRFHKEEVDKLLGVDAEKLLYEDLFLKGANE